MSWTLVADALVAILLIVTLVYVRRLSIKLEEMRAGRAEFEKLFAGFTQTTDQAASHLHHLKATADNTMQDLQARIERAQGLSGEFGKLGDDLKLLTDRAVSAADQLDASIGRARFLSGAQRPTVVSAAAVSQHPSMRANALEQALEDEPALPAGKLGALSGMR